MSNKDLTVIFPIYNEEKNIKNFIFSWKKKIDELKINYEIILAEDGSTDDTKNVLKKILIEDNDKIFIDNIVERKRGYANALIDAMKIANGKYIFCTDSDGQCSPKNFIIFWEKINHENTDIVIGYRKPRMDPMHRILMSKFFLILHKVLFFSKVIDPSCPYIIFKKNVFSKLKADLGLMVEGFWWGFIASAIKKGLEISQTKITHQQRVQGLTNVFHLSRIPSIAINNVLGLLKIKIRN